MKMRDAISELRDVHPAGFRRLWQTCGLALGFTGIFYGASYAIQGDTYVTSPSWHVMAMLPGHMNTFGWLYLLVSMAMFVRARTDNVFSYAPWFYCALNCLATLTIGASWIITGEVDLRQPWAFVAFATISGGLIRWPPDPRLSDDDS